MNFIDLLRVSNKALLAARKLPTLLRTVLPMVAVLLTFPEAANAACSRADVDHFLSRGFSREQVVALCGGEQEGASEPTAPIAVSASTEAERRLRDLLLRSVDADKVEVNAQGVSWTDKRCVEYAAPNLAGRPREICGPVRVTVARSAMTTGTLHRQILFFGEHAVELRGQVLQAWNLDTSTLSASDRRRVAESTPEQVSSVLLPLHGSAAPEDVAVSLQRWADTR